MVAFVSCSCERRHLHGWTTRADYETEQMRRRCNLDMVFHCWHPNGSRTTMCKGDTWISRTGTWDLLSSTPRDNVARVPVPVVAVSFSTKFAIADTLNGFKVRLSGIRDVREQEIAPVVPVLSMHKFYSSSEVRIRIKLSFERMD